MSSLFALEDGEHSAVTDSGLILSRSEKGLLSELEFAKQAVRRGWKIILPGSAEPDFDVLIKKPGERVVAIQVRGAIPAADHRSPNSQYYQIKCRRPNGEPYAAAAFDVLAVHLVDVDGWVFYTRAELGDRWNTSYTLPKNRIRQLKSRAPDARDPNNWDLLNDVADSLTKTQ